MTNKSEIWTAEGFEYWTIFDEDDEIVADCVRTLDDANIIAAAPELLEALEHCVNHGAMTGGEWVINKALAAVAKAKGEAMTCKTHKALKDLVAACQPVFCQALHHDKKDQHGDDEACPVVGRYEQALKQAREALGENK